MGHVLPVQKLSGWGENVLLRPNLLKDAVLLGSGSALLEQVSKGPQSRRIVLVNGSILRTFKHIGFKVHNLRMDQSPDKLVAESHGSAFNLHSILEGCQLGLMCAYISQKQVGEDPWLANLTVTSTVPLNTDALCLGYSSRTWYHCTRGSTLLCRR